MKRKPFILMLLLTMIVGSILSACGSLDGANAGNNGTNSDEEIVIKFAHVETEETAKGQAANEFKKLVEEELGGKVKVEVFPNSTLYNDNDGLEALQAGNIQMMAPSQAKLAGISDSFQVFSLPFLFKDAHQIQEFVKTPEGEELFSQLEDQNIKVMGLWYGGFKQITNDVQPLITPDDFKGLKFRVMAAGLLADQFEILGASSAVLPFSDLYISLEQGTVDGQENAFSDIYSQKFYEVQKYMTISNHAPATHPFIVNASFWNDLPDDIRQQLEDIMQKVTEKEVQMGIDLDQEFLQKIKDTGNMEITTLTEEQRQVFSDQMKPLYEKYSDEIGEKYIQAAMDLNQ